MSKTQYLSEPMIKALLIALFHGRLYPNRGEHLILGLWGEDVVTVCNQSGEIVQQGLAFELANAPLTTVPPNTFDALVRRGFITEDGDISDTGKTAIIALVRKVSTGDAYEVMTTTAEQHLSAMRQRGGDSFTALETAIKESHHDTE